MPGAHAEGIAASDDAAELVIIGAGPHGLTLLLRLLEDDPDLLDEGHRAELSMVHILAHKAFLPSAP